MGTDTVTSPAVVAWAIVCFVALVIYVVAAYIHSERCARGITHGFQPVAPKPTLSKLLDREFCRRWNAQVEEINDALVECFGPQKGKDILWMWTPQTQITLQSVEANPPKGGSGDSRATEARRPRRRDPRPTAEPRMMDCTCASYREPCRISNFETRWEAPPQ